MTSIRSKRVHKLLCQVIQRGWGWGICTRDGMVGWEVLELLLNETCWLSDECIPRAAWKHPAVFGVHRQHGHAPSPQPRAKRAFLLLNAGHFLWMLSRTKNRSWKVVCTYLVKSPNYMASLINYN